MIINNRLIYWSLVIFYLGIIFYLSSLSFPGNIKYITNHDKIIHMTEYGILSLLLYIAIKNSFSFPNFFNISILAVMICIFYGITDEFHQSFVPYRQADLFDVMADSAGAISMQAIIYILIKLKFCKILE